MFHKQPVEILQKLIRFNTTNPPGNEIECINYINNLLTDAGIKTTIFARNPNRPNLIASLKGSSNIPPLLLYGHVDVVTTKNQTWNYPPFDGILAEGYIWGRGALDMKGGLAMMLGAVLRAHNEKVALPGDIILVIVSDEEGDGSFGTQYLVENHPEIFKGVRYAIGEFGGFSLYIGSKKFYPIQVLEKQICSLKAIIQTGTGGHGSIPVQDSTTTKLAQLLQRIEKYPLPVHITPIVQQMFQIMASELSFPTNLIVNQLLNPRLTSGILRRFGESGKMFEPLFRNTVNATVIQGGEDINVIPSRIEVFLNGHLLPGYGPEEMINEVSQVVSNIAKLELIFYQFSPSEPDMGLFDRLVEILRELDPTGTPIPLLLPAVTDGRFLTQLGIQTYGFLPMNLPKHFNFVDIIHASNERIPVEAIEFGTDAIYMLLQRFGKVSP